MNRHVLIVAILWAAFTVAGEALVISYSPFPVAGAEEADVVDEAFTLLTYLAVPIFAFVLAIILYSMLRFSRRGEPSEDGPPMRTHTPFIVAWFVITTALTIFVIINPGIIGINELRADREVDLLVQIEVAVPERMSDEETELFRELARLRGEDVEPARDGRLFSRIRSAFQ
ncbi:MAG: hypothetical protein IIC84_00485 [Chloroflexi bacterium]|nr:hypothetical protein [Chloroflexota bacterium]